MLSILSAAPLLAPALATIQDEAHWPRWRGPNATGAVEADPPVKWTTEENVAWKVALPGHGKSTPIVWGDRLFVLAAVPTEEGTAEELAARKVNEELRTETPTTKYAFLAMAFDRTTGEALWESLLTEQLPVAGNHSTTGYASYSPVADADGLYVSLGSYGVYGVDQGTGDVLWEFDLGPQITRRGWGEGGSPAVHGDTLLVVADQEVGSYIVALDKTTGEERWRRERPEVSTWTTPLVVEAAGKTQAIVNGTTAARSYDLETGEVLWSCDGQTTNASPAPVSDGERVLITSGYRGSLAVVLPLDGKGDLRKTEGGILWSRTNGTPYVPSPVLVDGRVYMFSKNSGMLSCLDLATGEVLLDRERLDLGNVYASPLAAGGRLYVADRDGVVLVLEHDDGLNVIARNDMGEAIDAAPVAIGGALYLRTDTTLYAIGKP